MKLTVLSFGAGQDSTYMLYKIIRDKSYRDMYVTGRLIVVMCDTGSEHDHTYEHVVFIKQLCEENNIEFYFLTSDMGYHPNTWPSLEQQMVKNNSIMSMMFPRSCTDNLKIKPFYNFLNVWIAHNIYNQSAEDVPASTRNKIWIKKFADQYGKIDVMLGIATGEERRIKKNKVQLSLFEKKRPVGGVWMHQCINKTYPMVDEGIDREGAQNYIIVTPWPLPMPSLCDICPFQTKQEILWLYRFKPNRFEQWVTYEKNKIQRSPGATRNLGVKGEKLLPEILQEAINEFGHWTDEQLTEWKMSHGHCVKSVY